MIRIDAMWLSAEPIDMRAGTERLLARVVQVFGVAQAHHGYLRDVLQRLPMLRNSQLDELLPHRWKPAQA